MRKTEVVIVSFLLTVLLASCPGPLDSGNPPEPLQTVADPTFSIASGEIDSVPATISFACATADAIFHYTTDGNDPSTSSPSASSVVISGPLTLKVIAAKAGMNPSAIASASYTVRTPDDDASLSSLSYSVGALNPAFDASILTYELTVPDSAGTVTFTAASLSARARVKIAGAEWQDASVNASVAVSDGAVVMVDVEAEDGVSTSAYRITLQTASHGSWYEGQAGPDAMDDVQWKAVVSADGGTYLAFPDYGMELSRYLYTSTDGGSSWTELQAAGNRAWYGVSCSANGSIISAIYSEKSSFYLTRSLNGGSTWSSGTLVNSSSLVSVSMSSNGRYQYYSAHLETADGSYGAYDEVMYRSEDYGATWLPAVDFSQVEYGAGTSSTSDDLSWDTIVCSDDGSTIVVGGTNTWNYGGIMRSTDYGATWSETHLGAGSGIDGLTMTGNGSRLACIQLFSVHVSTDLGTTWTEVERPRFGSDSFTPDTLVYSSDGAILVAVQSWQSTDADSSNIFVSTNHGTSWVHKSNFSDSRIDYSWAQSANAGRMLMYRGNRIEESSDYGTTWTPLTGYGRCSWSFLSLSRDGRYQLAASSLNATNDVLLSSGWLYYSTDSGLNWTRLETLGKRMWSYLAVSDEGQRLVAGYLESNKHYVATSVDGGNHWSTPVAINGYSDPRGASISSDGDTIVLMSSSASYCNISTDGGASFSTITGISFPTGLAAALSEDGQHITLVTTNKVLHSEDRGATWESKSYESYNSWDKADVDDDGRTIAIASRNGYVSVSLDGGSSWARLSISGSNSTPEDANRCVGVAVTPDGRGVAVATGQTVVYSGSGNYASSQGSILVTMDGGTNWTRAAMAGTRAWTNLAASKDFRVIAATARETEDGVLGCR